MINWIIAGFHMRPSKISLREKKPLFFGGREATTGNTSAVRRLIKNSLWRIFDAPEFFFHEVLEQLKTNIPQWPQWAWISKLLLDAAFLAERAVKNKKVEKVTYLGGGGQILLCGYVNSCHILEKVLL